MKRIEHLKNYVKIKEAIEFGENVIVVTKWASDKTKAAMLVGFDCFFYEMETEKAMLFVNESKDRKIWLPKSQIIYYNKEEKGKQITKVFMGMI